MTVIPPGGGVAIPIPLPLKQVQLVPPPAKLIPDLTHSINQALTMLQGDETVAFVGVVTKKGDRLLGNLAFVAKLGDHWKVMGYVAKAEGWGDKVEVGATVKVAW